MKKILSPFSFIVIGCQLLFAFCASAQTGTWTQIAAPAPHPNMGACLLMTDGTVICHNTTGGGEGTGWDRLTPDASGSYVNGHWDSIASETYDRLFFSSQVLPSGKVYVSGGEYGAGGAEGGEVYDPVANSWTSCGPLPSGWNMYDAPSELLPDGTILEGPEIGASSSTDDILIWSPTTLNYTIGPNCLYGHDEAQWLKLRDSSVLFVGIATDLSNRYIPQTASWVNDGVVPGNLYDAGGEEMGCGTLLPNHSAIFFGATGYNAFYAPTNNTTPGSWTTADSFPHIGGIQTGQPDAPGAMMVNGHELLSVSQVGTSSGEFGSPCFFVEYDYTTNSFTQITSPLPGIGDSLPGIASFQTQMLDLPDGNVLLSISQSSSYSTSYFIYTPGSAPIPDGKPTINSILPDGCPNYIITGKLFNGISEGASYGDDWQMSTNYPLIRISNGTNVYYCKTTNWNRIGAVQTDSLEDTAYFTVPAIPGGTYSLVVVANGFASSPVLFSVFGISTISGTNVSCSISGSATVTGSGGLSPYTYLWSDAGSQTSATATGLSAGTYTVTVSDNNACSSTASIILTGTTSGLNVSAIVIANAACSVGGTDSVSVNGGIPPYTYQWSDAGSQTTITATGLSAGTYTVTVTDSSGCSSTASDTIIQTTSLNLTSTILSNVSCNGGNTGSGSVSVSGGVSPYTYLWNDGTSQVTATATGLGSGTYMVTVTDSSGCSGTIGVTITQPAPLTVSTTTLSGCGGNGSATATQSGGTSPYTYLWNDGNSQTTSTATGLSTGTYTVIVQDSCGASVTASAIVSPPSPISVSTSAGGSGCGNNGSATAAVSGGSSPYTYLWNDGGSQTTATATGLTTGTYTVTVEDGCGASVTASAIVVQSFPLIVSVTGNASGCSANTGSATAAVSGGTSPYTYLWSGGGGTDATATGLAGGNYTVTVSDSCGTTMTASVTIAQSVVTISIAARVIEVCDGIGYITAHPATGGVSPYTYSWSPSGGTDLTTATNLGAGNYTITATDNNGCSGTAAESITLPPQLTASANILSNITCNGGNDGSVSSTFAGGTSPYDYSWFPGGGTNSSEGGLAAGVYIITVSDSNGCMATASVTLTEPAGMNITQYSVDQTQNQVCGGLAAVTVTGGGVPPYTYLWTTGSQTTDTISGQCAGVYCCTITGNNGCAQNTCVTIRDATGIAGVSNASDITIYPDPNTGSFTVSGVSGGQVIELYNYLGQNISSVIADNATVYFNISTKPDGIYLIRIENKDGSVVTQKKIVKVQ